jgi:hypothetical protein
VAIQITALTPVDSAIGGPPCLIQRSEKAGWLGRQDSNLGMAESKSGNSSLYISADSEKRLEISAFDPLDRIALFRISE